MSSGRLLLRGQDISALPVHKRSTRLVWQNFALFPHLNVRQNIAFGLTLGRHDKAAVKAKVAADRRDGAARPSSSTAG